MTRKRRPPPELIAAVAVPAGAVGWWHLLPEATPDWRVAVLVIFLVAGYATFLIAPRQPGMVLPRLGVFTGLGIACAGELWFTVGADLAAGRLGPSSLGRWWMVRQQGWAEMALLLAPLPGILLSLVQVPSLAVAAAAGALGAGHRRRRATSDLYGKSEFMSRAHRRTLETGRGLLLGQASGRTSAPLTAWPLEGSAITLAPPRTGKGATIALNLLSPANRGPSGSTITIDPRGETYCIVAHRRKQMGRTVLLVDPFGVVENHHASFPEDIEVPTLASQTYNPLDFIRPGEAESVRDIGVLLDAILTPPTSETQSTSQHFYQSAREIIAGAIAWVRFQEVRLGDHVMARNLETVRHVTSLAGDELANWADEVAGVPPFCGGLSLKSVQRRLSVGPEEAGSQASTIANQLSFLSQPGLLANTARSTFDPAVISDGATDLFVVVPDDMIDEVRSWLRLWITIPNAIPNRQALKRDLLLIIDEMPRLGYLKPVMDAYNLAAGKGVHFWCVAQSVSALEQAWGKDPTRTLIDLAEVIQILGFPRTDARGAEDFAKAIGHTTFVSESESRSGTVSEQQALVGSSQNQVSESTQLVREFLVPPDDLMTMAPDEQYIIAAGKTVPRNALHLRHARYWERADARHLAKPNPFVLRKDAGGLSAEPLPPRAENAPESEEKGAATPRSARRRPA